MCWGGNSFGQLGIGSTVEQHSPQMVSLGSGALASQWRDAKLGMRLGTWRCCGVKMDDAKLDDWPILVQTDDCRVVTDRKVLQFRHSTAQMYGFMHVFAYAL